MTSKSELVEAVANENRLAILQVISSEPHYITQIVEQTKLSRPAVCFHLNVLEKSGIVESKYQILEPPHSPSGKAARFYSVNKPKLNEALTNIKTLISAIPINSKNKE